MLDFKQGQLGSQGTPLASSERDSQIYHAADKAANLKIHKVGPTFKLTVKLLVKFKRAAGKVIKKIIYFNITPT